MNTLMTAPPLIALAIASVLFAPDIASSASDRAKAETSSGATKEGAESWLTIGASTAKDDGTGSIDFELNKEISPDAAKLKLKQDIRLTKGVRVVGVEILPQGEARVDFADARPNTKVEAFLPYMRASEMMLEDQKLEQDDTGAATE